MMSYELSYASPDDPAWKRWTMRAIENLSGRVRLLPVYDGWRADLAGGNPRAMNDLLDTLGTRLALHAPHWPVRLPPSEPLVMIANHPFGIGDGLAALALAEQLGRPYRVLINNDFMRVPEIRPMALPIDFSKTRDAIETNLKSRIAACRLLKEGVTIIVFPAGGVATAERVFGGAEELPWKGFVAKLVQQAHASVLPVYFEGQNSRLFHLVSRYSLMLRLSLLVSEFRNFIGATIDVHVGRVVPFSELESRHDRRRLLSELYGLVHRLAPGNEHLAPHELHERPAEARRRYPWDRPAPRPRAQAAGTATGPMPAARPRQSGILGKTT